MEVDIDLYRQLFVHRSDVFAVQNRNGTYTPVRRELTDEDIVKHLNGEWSIGTYVIDPEDQSVSSVVFDLDVHDKKAEDTLYDYIVDLVPWQEDHCVLAEFSGNKGSHFWLFLSEPLPAEYVRRWIAADFMPRWRETARENGWPEALEVFPKQDSVSPGGFGNLVKLPFGVHAVSGARSTLIEGKGADCLENVYFVDIDQVPDREPVTPQRTRRTVTRSNDYDTHTPFACVDHIMHEGAPQGMRDNAMFHLALYCHGHGFTEEQALETCEAANEEFDPPMSTNDVRHKVEHAYSGRYESAGCGADWLQGLCPGPCQAGWHVSGRKAKPDVLAGVTPGDAIEVDVVAIASSHGKRRVTLSHPDALNRPTLVVK